MNDERAVAAAIHAGLRSDDVTYLYTGDCRGCGECCSRFLPVSPFDRVRLEAYVRRNGIEPAEPRAECDLLCPYLTDGRECAVYAARPEICRAYRCDRHKSEGSLPTGLRVYANIMKHHDGFEWFEFSHHGVMGDGNVRVGCYKQGWPEVYEWEDGEDKPTIYTFDALSRRFGWDGYEEYGDTRYAADEYDEEFDFLGWHFHFWGDDTGGTPRYGATMSRDGETWECDCDCMFGAGFDDIH